MQPSLPIEKLEGLVRRHSELDELLCRPEVLADRNQISKLNKERSDLEPLVSSFARYRDIERKLKEAQEALSDPELRELAEQEIAQLSSESESLARSIETLLLPADPNDKK